MPDAPAADPVAAAEAAVAAAEKAAQEAREKAAELLKKAEAAKAAVGGSAPAPVEEPPDLGQKKKSAPAASAPASKAPAAPVHFDDHDGGGIVTISPNPEGLFGTDQVDEAAGERFTPETAYMRGMRSKAAIAVLLAAVALIAAGVIYLLTESDASARMKWFLSGTSCVMDDKSKGPRVPDTSKGEAPGNLNCLKLYVEQTRMLLEEKWKAEDFRSKHIYGSVTLTYFPQDTRVDVFQTKYAQDGRAWARNDAGLGDMVCAEAYVQTPADKIMTDAIKDKARCERPLVNATADLKENQFIESLPLKNLPIFETDKCTDKSTGWDAGSRTCKVGGTEFDEGAVMTAYTYEYRLVFSREGYEPREFVWRQADWTRAPAGWIMDWSGLDLVPKPETRLKNFALGERDLYCYQVLNDVVYEKIPQANKDLIFKRNGFKTEEEYRAAEQVLRRGEFQPWYEKLAENIKKLDKKACEEGTDPEIPEL
ncbi:MAG: hypothetical protein KC635_19170 [Myxococcales bacterium]|nr:hypothetical protein [Myxococcales bacterium]MCB9731548.1 hypothetical protein [Deltaproteobacteria bacterium]